MISKPLLRQHIDSACYQRDVAERLNYRLSDSDMIVFIATIRRLALKQCSTSMIAEGTSPGDAILAYLRGIEPIAAREFAISAQINSLMFGSNTERLETMALIQFPKARDSPEPCLFWTRGEFEAFVSGCSTFDQKTIGLLCAARLAAEDLRIAQADAEYAIGELNRLADQLAREKESQEIKTTWKRISEAAPTIGSILSAIASIAKILS